MLKDINIPDEAVSYILFQRTAYLKIVHSLPYRALSKISPASLYKPAVFLEARLRKSVIKANYLEDMRQEYEGFKDYLPEKVTSILDIGCGVAGINIFLQRHYGHDIDFYLLDKTGVEDEVYYLFSDRGAFYNSLDIARDVLTTNGIANENIHLLEATDTNDINIHGKIDLIISLISWGFHYPVSTYLEQAYDKLAESGRLIIDVRKDTDGLEGIREKFGNISVIEESGTRQRILAIKQDD